MTLGDRIYNEASNKQWSSEVYQKAKGVAEEVLSSQGIALPFNKIIEAMKQRYPLLCDDSIKDRKYPKLPYWKHLVATAISALQMSGKVRKADGGWIWVGVKTAPPVKPDKLTKEVRSQPEKSVEMTEKGKEGRLTHDELIQKIKEMGEIVGKTAEIEWGPVYKHDCVWKDNPYANPNLVVEVCDKGNLDKDIASLLWAVKNWGANGILVIFEESDFHAAQKKLTHGSQVYPLKAGDMLKLYTLLQAGYIQAIRSIFSI